MRWEEIDRLEWNGEMAVLHRRPTVLGAGAASHSLEVPAHRRAELEGVLATHVGLSR